MLGYSPFTEDTIDKLFGDREYQPRYVIGMMNVRNAERCKELIKISQDRNTFEQALLIFSSKSDSMATFLNHVQAHSSCSWLQTKRSRITFSKTVHSPHADIFKSKSFINGSCIGIIIKQTKIFPFIKQLPAEFLHT